VQRGWRPDLAPLHLFELLQILQPGENGPPAPLHPLKQQAKNDTGQLLVVGVQRGWRPDLARLEYLEKVEEMQRADYREAWAWVHFMMHSSPDTRMVLLEYLQELRTNPNPGLLRDRLTAAIPDLDQRLVGYVAGLNGPGRWAASFPSAGRPTVRAVNN